MQLLKIVASFGTNKDILKHIYIHIIRVILEGSCQVWDGSLTIKNRRSLERVQKQCLKIILPNLKYKEALKQLDINDLQTRRTELITRFAKLNQNDGKISHFFEKNYKIHNMKTRNARKYNVQGNTNRYLKSPILHMKRLLNSIGQNWQNDDKEENLKTLYLWIMNNFRCPPHPVAIYLSCFHHL